MQEVYSKVEASPVRRLLAVAMQAVLGLILIYVAFDSPPAFGWQAFLLLLGVGSLWVARRTFYATQTTIELSDEGLMDTSGELIVSLDEIARVERGMLALKPTNGFMIKLA